MGNYVHEYYSIFSYFATQLGEPLEWWADKRVLDFGGNWGNVLRDPKCTIRQENYTCLDVSVPALERGAGKFPNARWLYYNRWNLVYNFEGGYEPMPDMGTFDVVLVYSVFTTTSASEMFNSINVELLPLLNPGGVLLNTYLSLDDDWPLRFFLRKRGNTDEQISQLLERARQQELVYHYGKDELLTDESLLQGKSQSTMLTFYKDSLIKTMFPQCEIKPVVLREENHCQKCMVFR